MFSLAKKSTLLLFVALFVAVSLGGVFASQMLMEDGAMQDCPFMGVPALCDMSPLAHLLQWQETFAATAQIAVLACIAVAFLWISILSTPVRLGHFRLRSPDGRLFSPLRLAFARGIIHTKVY